MWFRRKKKTIRNKQTPLDRVIASFGGDAFTGRDAAANSILLGATGSGKSSLMRAMLGWILPDSGALLIAAKDGDADEYARIALSAGRQPIVINGSGAVSINLFDLMLHGVEPEDAGIVGERAWETIAAVVNREARRNASGDNGYFLAAERQMVRNIIELLVLAGEPVTPSNILSVVRHIPKSGEQLTSEEWLDGYLATSLVNAKVNAKRSGRTCQFYALRDYFTLEIVGLSDKTRSCVTQGVSATGDILARGAVSRSLFGNGNLDPAAAIEHGAVVIVDYPFVRHGAAGTALASGMLYAFQQAALKRRVNDNSALYFLVCDEFQEVVSSEHAPYLAVCRSQRVPMIVATQCINSLIEKFGADSGGQQRAEVLISNFAGGKFITNPTPATAKWLAENLIGMERKLFFNTNISRNNYDTLGDVLFGTSGSVNSGASQQMVLAIQPQELFRLRKGGAECRYLVDAVWFAGRTLARGKYFTKFTINQKEG